MQENMVDFWVVGCNGHIGSLLTNELIESGNRVLGIDIQPETSMKRSGIEYKSLELGDLDNLEKQLRHLATPRLGFVHLSGLTGDPKEIGWRGGIERQTLDLWQKTLAVNLSSAFIFAKELSGRKSTESAGGASAFSMVFTSSIYGSVGPNPSLYPEDEMPNPAAYGVSKAGLESLARYLTTTSQGRIRANTVVPGGILRGQTSDFIATYSARTPLGRMGSEVDVVNLITFLLSEKSEYIAGQSLKVDGGFTAW